jgi:hypothetical protein
MKTWVLILIALLALATIIVWTFATAALYRRGQCRAYPYYWCDTKWKCCSKDNANSNCDAAGGSGTHGSYKITDKFYGTNTTANPGDDDHNSYYYLCIAPANAIIAANPGVSLACLYQEGGSCVGQFANIPSGYNLGTYTYDSTCLTSTPNAGCNGLGGRCYYYSVDDPPNEQYNPNSVPSYTYLPGYSNGGPYPVSGNGYLQNPQLGSTNSYKSGYYFAGNAGPNVGAPTNGFNNGPNQADSTYYSAWNRLGKNTSGAGP